MKKWLFLGLAVIVVAVAALIAVRTRHPERPRAPNPKQADRIPAVDAEITAVEASPDYTRVGLLFVRGIPGAPAHYSVGVFDPVRRRLVAEEPLSRGERPSLGLLWSADSKWLAAPEYDSGNGVVILGRDGARHRIALGKKPDLFLWRLDKPGRFIYSPDQWAAKRGYCYEFDLTSGRERRIPVSYHPERLFNVRGKPRMAYFKLTGKDRDTDYSAIYVAEVDTGRQIVRIPLFDTTVWDFSNFDMSPNGDYFYYRAFYSASTRDVVARTRDAPTVFKKPRLASLWQDDVEGEISGVDWLQTPAGKKLYDNDLNQAVVPNVVPFVLNLDTGSRHELMWDPLQAAEKFRAVRLWKPFHLVPGQPNRYIVVTDRGLEFYSDNDEPPPVLLLRHKPNRTEKE